MARCTSWGWTTRPTMARCWCCSPRSSRGDLAAPPRAWRSDHRRPAGGARHSRPTASCRVCPACRARHAPCVLARHDDGLARMTSRAGFVALAGRPNVGKSTLINGLVGQKVAIVSDKPQTTRRAIRGVATAGDHQLVLVDLPGVQRPRDALTERMQRRVERELEDSDAALMVINAEEGVGPGDRFIASALTAAKIPVVVAVNKVDRLDKAGTLTALMDAATLEIGDDIF